MASDDNNHHKNDQAVHKQDQQTIHSNDKHDQKHDQEIYYDANRGTRYYLSRYYHKGQAATYVAIEGGTFIISDIAKVLDNLFHQGILEVCIIPRALNLLSQQKTYFWIDIDEHNAFSIETIFFRIQAFLQKVFKSDLADNVLIEKNQNLEKYHIRFLDIICPRGNERLELSKHINKKLFNNSPIIDISATSLRFPLFNKYKRQNQKWIKQSCYIPMTYDNGIIEPQEISEYHNKNGISYKYLQQCDIFKYSSTKPVTFTVVDIRPDLQQQTLNKGSFALIKKTKSKKKKDQPNYYSNNIYYPFAPGFLNYRNQQLYGSSRSITNSVNPHHHVAIHPQIYSPAAYQHHFHIQQTPNNDKPTKASHPNPFTGPPSEIDQVLLIHYSQLYDQLHDKKIYKIVKNTNSKGKTAVYFNSKETYCIFKNDYHRSSQQFFVYYVQAKRLWRTCHSPKCADVTGKKRSKCIWWTKKPGRQPDQPSKVLWNITDYAVAEHFYALRSKPNQKYIYWVSFDAGDLNGGTWLQKYQDKYYMGGQALANMKNDICSKFKDEILNPLKVLYSSEDGEVPPEEDVLRTRFFKWQLRFLNKIQNYSSLSGGIISQCQYFFKFKRDEKSRHDSKLIVFDHQGVWDISTPEEGLLTYDQVKQRIPKDTFVSNEASTSIKFEKRSEISDERFKEIDDFMKKVFPDPDTRRFFYQYIFICLTKEKPKILIYLYGEHNNGKTALIEFIKYCFGNYAFLGDDALLTDKPDPTILHQSTNARMVYIDECTQKPNQKTIRKYTGNQDLFGRMIYGINHVINCHFKLICSANGLPINNTEKNNACRYIYLFCQSKFADSNVQFHEDWEINEDNCIYPANSYYVSDEFKKRSAMPFLWRVIDNSADMIQTLQRGQPLPIPVPSKQSKILAEIVMSARSTIYTMDQFVHSYLKYKPDARKLLMRDIFNKFIESPFKALIPENIENDQDQKINRWFSKKISATIGQENVISEEFNGKYQETVYNYVFIDQSKMKPIDEQKLKQHILTETNFKMSKSYNKQIHKWIRDQCFYHPGGNKDFLGSDFLSRENASRSTSLSPATDNIIHPEIFQNENHDNSYTESEAVDAIHPETYQESIVSPVNVISNPTKKRKLTPTTSTPIFHFQKTRSTSLPKSCSETPSIASLGASKRKIVLKIPLKKNKINHQSLSQSTNDSGTTVATAAQHFCDPSHHL